MELMPESDDMKSDDLEVNKDKTRVRRPPNAFMIFGKQFRKILAKKFEDLSNKDISKLLGEEWKQMDSETKTKYHKMADVAHREHLQKYPGYYYSPLEARQRKAERKRKSKMSKTNYNSNDNHITNGSVVGAFNGNRPILFRNPMYPMVRPMFGTPYQRVNFGQQFFRFRPNYSFGGLVPLGPFAMPRPYAMGPVFKSGCNDGIDFSVHPFCSQNTKISRELELNEVETNNSGAQVKDSVESPDITLLSSLLPPMHNPNTEVTPVQQNEHFLSDRNSMNDNEVIKMTNAIVEQEIALSQNFKEGLEEDHSLLNDLTVSNE